MDGSTFPAPVVGHDVAPVADTADPAPRLNKREASKIATRARILAVATDLFRRMTYRTVTIRRIAQAAGFSTGAVFANFKDKDDLWRAAMGCEPPKDSHITRAAPAMLDALRGLIAVRPGNWGEGDDPIMTAAWRYAEAVVAHAEGGHA